MFGVLRARFVLNSRLSRSRLRNLHSLVPAQAQVNVSCPNSARSGSLPHRHTLRRSSVGSSVPLLPSWSGRRRSASPGGRLSPKRKEKARERPPRCIVIAGPNGAGKATFALEFLPSHAKVIHFVNADSIAGGLSPLRPELAAIAAGRLFLKELDRLAAERKDFAFESTLSGTSYVTRLERWKKAGYRIEIIYLTLPSVEIALSRIAARVRQGGHGVPKPDVLRRSQRSWSNFQSLYRPLADWWWIYDNSRERPKLVEQGP